MLPLEVMALFLTLGVFSVISYKKRLLNIEGILIANIVGIAIFQFSQWNLAFFFVAVLFFVVAEAGTIYSKRKGTKHDVRTTGNILGNSGTAVLALILGFQFGFFAALAAALADTLSGEIGLLSKKKPVLITNFKQVEPGTDGGITRLGLMAGVFGAAVIGGVHFALYQDQFLFLVLVASGFFGSIADSFFGAILERQKKLGNAEVNFLGSLSGTLMAWVLSSI
jgi:uncharacterized protein (TIGR00297 family)